jgi:pimeloyl-ACP methyl ester carboxylesterase
VLILPWDRIVFLPLSGCRGARTFVACPKKTMGNYLQLGRQTAKKIKDSQLVELEDIGHMPHIEAFDRFADHSSAF